MPTFRKKPVEIEAYPVRDILRIFFDEGALLADLPDWIQRGLEYRRLTPTAHDYLQINTLEGCMRAEIDDWLIKGVKGELYPCKPDIFEDTYEKVD